jgi:hypothetical protein
MKALKLLLFAVLIAAIAVAWWMWRQPRGKWVPASGGSNLSVKLPDRAHFLQKDPRWAGHRLGGRDTLGGAGCLVTSVAMAMSDLGHPTDPGQLNAALAAEKGVTAGGWLLWDAVSRVTRGALRAEVYAEPSLRRLDACLARGDYPIVKYFIRGVIPHWVVLVGKRNGTYFMRDPLIAGAAPVPLTRRTQAIFSVRCIGVNPRAVRAPRTAARIPPAVPAPSAPPAVPPRSASSAVPAPSIPSAVPPQPVPPVVPPPPAPSAVPAPSAPAAIPPRPVPSPPPGGEAPPQP